MCRDRKADAGVDKPCTVFSFHSFSWAGEGEAQGRVCFSKTTQSEERQLREKRLPPVPARCGDSPPGLLGSRSSMELSPGSVLRTCGCPAHAPGRKSWISVPPEVHRELIEGGIRAQLFLIRLPAGTGAWHKLST